MSKKDMEIKMTNVIPLFPNETDAQYWDRMMPALIESMQMLWAAVDSGDREVICKVSESLMVYVKHSMQFLDSERRNGGVEFPDKTFSCFFAPHLDALAADYIQAIDGKYRSEFVEKIRKACQPRKKAGSKMEPKVDMDGIGNE